MRCQRRRYSGPRNLTVAAAAAFAPGSLVPGGDLHRAQPRQADAEPRLQQRSRTHVDEVRVQPGHRSRAFGLSRSKGVLARAYQPLGDGHGAGDPAQGAVLRFTRPEALADAVATSGRPAPPAASGSVPTCSRCLWTASPTRFAGSSTSTSTPAPSRADRAASTSWVRLTARRLSTTTRRRRRSGPTTARTSTRRSRFRISRPPTAGASGWRGSATGSTPTKSRPSSGGARSRSLESWRFVGSPRDPSCATARRRAARAAYVARARRDSRADRLPGSAEIELEYRARSVERRRRSVVERRWRGGGRRHDVKSARGVRRPPQVPTCAGSPGLSRPPRQPGPLARRPDHASHPVRPVRRRGLRQRRRDRDHRPRSSPPSPSTAWSCSRAAARDRRTCGHWALSPDRASAARRASSTASRRRAGACP